MATNSSLEWRVDENGRAAITSLPLKVSTNHCCGVRELFDVRGSANNDTMEKDLLTLTERLHTECAFIFFTATNLSTYGNDLSSLILKHGFGTVWKSEGKVNPNSGNLLYLYIWTLDRPAIARWIEEKQKSAPNPSIDLFGVPS